MEISNATPLKIELKASDWNVILAALSEMPYNKVIHIITSVQSQVLAISKGSTAEVTPSGVSLD